MKIAIASDKNDLNSIISNRGGRADYYLVFEDKKLIEALKNPFAVGGGGAGFSVVEMLNDKNIDLIICGKFGSNMISAINDKNLKFKEIQNKTIQEVLEEI
jgi:predicted Fe-Mo cluster-binding NifX family protein